MANFGNYDIPLFEDDIQTIKEFFRIVLNTIIFHRWLGESKFEDTESIFSNITYVKIKNESLQKTIEFNVSQLEKSLLKSNRVQVSLKFYQKKIQKFYIMQELTNLWEKWEFLFAIKKNTDVINTQKENKIREYLSYILEKLNDKFDFMPDFDVDSQLPEETFPFEININANISDDDFLSLIKDMSIKSALKEDVI